MKTATWRAAAAGIAMLSLFSMAAADAATPKGREGTLGTGKAKGGAILTQAQLRTCLTQQDTLSARNQALATLRGTLESERAELDRNGAALRDDRASLERNGEVLKNELAALDRTSKDAVDAFNARNALRDRALEDFNARAAAREKQVEAFGPRQSDFNAQLDSLQAERKAWAQTCEGQRYLEADFDKIKAGK